MKTTKTTGIQGCRLIAAFGVALISVAAQCSTNVFNDAVFWFRGGKDICNVNGDSIPDGCMQQGEFFDDLHANEVDHLNHRMSMVSYAGKSGKYSHSVFSGNAAFATERVVFPALGTNVAENLQVLHISNDAKKIGDTSYYFPFVVNPRSIFVEKNISNEYTVVGRIRLDDGTSRNECFLRLGYKTNDLARQGMWLGFTKPSSWYAGCKRIGGYCTANSDSNDHSFQLDLPVPTNTWVDIAVVVGNGKLRVGVAAPVSLPGHSNNPTIAFAETDMWTDNCPLIGSDYYRMFCLDGQTAPKDINGADTTSFIGSIQQLAIWGRALEDHEVMEAFGMPRPAIFRTGFDNGESNEFGGTRSGALQTIDGLGSWQNVYNTMAVGDTWTVNFTALRDEAGLPQIFSIKSLSDSETAQIEPILTNASHDTTLGAKRVAPNGHTFWRVPANLITEGANTLIIKRKNGGSDYFKMDAMELGGSLGVGTEAASTNDGRTPPVRTATGVPSAADPNLQHWPQELQPYSGITNLRFRVWVDPAVLDVASFKFRTLTLLAAKSGYTLQGDEKFTLYVNGKNKGDYGTNTEIESIDLDLASDELLGGWNLFELTTSNRDNCRWYVGYYRFETSLSKGFSIPPCGTCISFR